MKKTQEASSGGYHPKGKDAPKRASGGHGTKRRGFNCKVTINCEVAVKESKFVMAHRVGKNEWDLAAADGLFD